jgi:hypothetical protein
MSGKAVRIRLTEKQQSIFAPVLLQTSIRSTAPIAFPAHFVSSTLMRLWDEISVHRAS